MHYKIARWGIYSKEGRLVETGYIGGFMPHIFRGETIADIKEQAKKQLKPDQKLVELLESAPPQSSFYYHDDWGPYTD